MESATVAQLSAVLRAAATYSASAGAGAGHPADSQAGSRLRIRILLEWSALLVASLAISTSPASYNFVLLALPVCVLTALLLQREWYGWLAVLLIVYLGIGFPVGSPTAMVGPMILLYVPRLPLTLALLLGIYLLLWRDQRAEDSSWDWTHSHGRPPWPLP